MTFFTLADRQFGMIHEHNNPRGESIKWDDSKVFAWAKDTQGWSEKTTEENILEKYDQTAINGSTFDPLSIMLYFFPAELTTNNVGTKQNLRLSGEDCVWFSKIYFSDTAISPAEFYKNTYGQTLEESLKESDRMREEIRTGKTAVDWRRIAIIAGVIAGVLLIILIIRALFSGGGSSQPAPVGGITAAFPVRTTTLAKTPYVRS